MKTIMYNLLAYPQTLEKLRAELQSAGASRPYPKWSELSRLPYLDACVQEALRMHPPFALPFERIVPEGGITVFGHYIPAGTIIGASPYVVNRHKPTFGQDAEFWRPERWLEGDADHRRKLDDGLLTVSLTSPQFSFLFFIFRNHHLLRLSLIAYIFKFGAGRRICLGKHIGIFEIKKLVPFLILKYDVSTHNGFPYL
jgi:cytochrome P450